MISAPQAPKIFKNTPVAKNTPPYCGAISNKGGVFLSLIGLISSNLRHSPGSDGVGRSGTDQNQSILYVLHVAHNGVHLEWIYDIELLAESFLL